MGLFKNVLFYPNERLDLVDIQALQSSIYEYLGAINEGYITNENLVVNGFLIERGPSLQISLSPHNDALIMAEKSGDNIHNALWVGSGDASIDREITTSLAPNTTNYIHAKLVTEDGALDSRAFWDPTARNRQGDEFTDVVNTCRTLKVELEINQTGFSSDTDVVALARVVTGVSSITLIEDHRPLLFSNSGKYSSRVNQDKLITDFTRLDRNIKTQKDFIDIVLQSIEEVKGSEWYNKPEGDINTKDLFTDTQLTTLTGDGEISHSSTSAGELTFGQLKISVMSSNVVYTVEGTKVNLTNNQVAYVDLDENDERGTTGTRTLIVANRGDVPFDKDIYWIFYRDDSGSSDGSIYVRGVGLLEPGESETIGEGGKLDQIVDREITLIGGGLWSWILSSNTLMWVDNAYISLPGLSKERNTIASATNTNLTEDGSVLYVDINRSEGDPAQLPVRHALIHEFVNQHNRFIIARRAGDYIYLGTTQDRVRNFENIELSENDEKVNDTRLKVIAIPPFNSSVNILPSKMISNGKILFSYVGSSITSKFPRADYRTGAYDGGGNHSNLSTLAFGDPVGGVVSVTLTGPTFTSVNVGEIEIDSSRFHGVTVVINIDDTIGVIKGESSNAYEDVVNDDNIAVAEDEQIALATIILAVVGGKIEDINNTSIIERRKLGFSGIGGGGGGGGAASNAISFLQDVKRDLTEGREYEYATYMIPALSEDPNTLVESNEATYSKELSAWSFESSDILITKNLLEDHSFTEDFNDIDRAVIFVRGRYPLLDSHFSLGVSVDGGATYETTVANRLNRTDTFMACYNIDRDNIKHRPVLGNILDSENSTTHDTENALYISNEFTTGDAISIVSQITIPIQNDLDYSYLLNQQGINFAGHYSIAIARSNADGSVMDENYVYQSAARQISSTNVPAGATTLTAAVDNIVLEPNTKFHIVLGFNSNYRSTTNIAPQAGSILVRVNLTAESQLHQGELGAGNVITDSTIPRSSLVFGIVGRDVDLRLRYIASRESAVTGIAAVYGYNPKDVITQLVDTGTRDRPFGTKSGGFVFSIAVEPGNWYELTGFLTLWTLGHGGVTNTVDVVLRNSSVTATSKQSSDIQLFQVDFYTAHNPASGRIRLPLPLYRVFWVPEGVDVVRGLRSGTFENSLSSVIKNYISLKKVDRGTIVVDSERPA